MRILTSILALALCACCPQDPEPCPVPMPDESSESTGPAPMDLPPEPPVNPNVCCVCLPDAPDSCKVWLEEPKACEAISLDHHFTADCSAANVPMGCPGICPI